MSSNIKEGWLTKKGKVIKNWKRRWFVLDDNMLSFYEKPGKKQLGTIPLKCVIKVNTDTKKENTFDIVLSNRTYYLTTDTQEEFNEWYSLLTNIFNQHSIPASSPPPAHQPIILTTPPQPKPRLPPPIPKQISNRPPKSHYSLDDFTILKTLGRGSFGKVQLVKQNDTGKLYAMKSMHKKLLEESNQIQSTILERDILLTIRFPFITSAHYTFQTDTKVYIVLEYVSGGDLQHRIREEDYFSEQRARLYAAEIALGLGYLHKNGYIYRDIKSSNILIDSEGHIKITDFGFTKSGMNKSNDTTSTFCGTVEYVAPEVILDKPYTKDVDWWGFGVLLYEMLVGVTPFFDENPGAVYRAIVLNEPEFPPRVSEGARAFLMRLLQKDPALRIGSGEADLEDIKKDPFFEGIDWNEVLERRTETEWRPPARCEESESPIRLRLNERNSSVFFDSPIHEETQLKFRGFSQINFEEIK